MKSVHRRRRLLAFLVLAFALVGSAFNQYRQVQMLSETNAALEQQVATLIAEKTALGQKLETLNDALESLQKEKQIAEDNFAKARKNLNIARQDLTRTQSALSRSRTQTASLTRKFQAARKQVAQATRRFQETADQLAVTTSRLDQAEEEKRELVSAVRERDGQIASLRRENDEKNRMLAALRAEKDNGEWASAAGAASRRGDTGDAPGDIAVEPTRVQPAVWSGFRSPTRFRGESAPDGTGIVFRVTVTSSGTAAQVITVQPNGDRSTANYWKTVIERDTRWRPETQNGTPVPSRVTVTIGIDEAGAPTIVPAATSRDADEAAAVPAGA